MLLIWIAFRAHVGLSNYEWKFSKLIRTQIIIKMQTVMKKQQIPVVGFMKTSFWSADIAEK